MKIKNRQQLLLIVAVSAIALFAADKLLLDPLTASWKQRAKKVADLRKQIEAGEQLRKRRNSLVDTWDEMRTNTLPNNTSVAEQTMLKAFDRWAQDSRITVTSQTPQWKHDADEYVTLEWRVEASGTLDRVSRFLYEIENDPLAVKLENVEISARDTEGQQLALGLQLSALVLIPQDQRP